MSMPTKCGRCDQFGQWCFCEPLLGVSKTFLADNSDRMREFFTENLDLEGKEIVCRLSSHLVGNYQIYTACLIPFDEPQGLAEFIFPSLLSLVVEINKQTVIEYAVPHENDHNTLVLDTPIPVRVCLTHRHRFSSGILFMADIFLADHSKA